MLKKAVVLTVVLAACSAAYPEDGGGRLLEENVVVSPVILKGKIGDAAGTFKDGNIEYHKTAVIVEQVVRHPGAPPKNGATITIWGTTTLKKDEELILFTGAIDSNGYPLRGRAEGKELDRVKALLALEAKADKELDGKDKLAAAFFHAHKLRPVLLAEVEAKNLVRAGAVPAADREKLFTVLGWALQESGKKEAGADFKRLTESLRRVLSGTGGLPDIRTRKERLTQYLAAQLNNKNQRKRYDLAKLVVADAAAARKIAQLKLGRQIVGRPVRPEPKESPPVAPPVSSLGRAVNGLALQIRSDRSVCDLAEAPAEGVNLTVTFRNTGKNTLSLNAYMIFSVLARVYIVDPRGRVSLFSEQDRLAAQEVPAMGPWSFKQLEPGAALDATVAVPAASLRRSGKYTLCVEYNNEYGRQFGIANAWAGKVASPKIEIAVVRHKPPEPEPEKPPPPPEKPASTQGPAPKPAVINPVGVQVRPILRQGVILHHVETKKK